MQEFKIPFKTQFNSKPILGIGAGARTYSSIADYIIGGNSKPNENQIYEYIKNVNENSLKITAAYFLDDEERARRKLVLNLYRFDLKDFKRQFGERFNWIFEKNSIYYKIMVFFKKKMGFTLLHKEGYKYRDIISWSFFSKKVCNLDIEFYENIRKMDII